jgi:ribonuclease HI
LPKAYKILFPCTNNITKYEALINGTKIATEWRVDQLDVFGDSQLVINQVNDMYQTKDEKLVPYKCMVDDLKNYFAHITFQQVP